MCENKEKRIMSQLDEDMLRLWSGSGTQNIPPEWEMHDMENFDLCIQLYAHVVVDLVYDLRLKLKAVKDHLFPVNMDVCSDPEDQTKMPILKWFVLMRYIRKRKKVKCRMCNGPCLKNIFLVLEALEKDLFQWEKGVFKFSEERPDEDYKRVIKAQHNKWESKYSPLAELQSVVSNVNARRSPSPRLSSPRRSSSLVNLSNSNLLNKYRNTAFRHLFKGTIPKASSSRTSTETPKNETLQPNSGSESSLSYEDSYKPTANKIRCIKAAEIITEPELTINRSASNNMELAQSLETNTAIFFKPKFISFSIDKILKDPYKSLDSSSQAANQEENLPDSSVSPSKEEEYQEIESPKLKDTLNSENPSKEMIEEQSKSTSTNTDNKQNDPSKATEPDYSNPVAGPSNMKDQESPYCGPRRSLSCTSLCSNYSDLPFRNVSEDKKGNEFQSKAYAFVNEHGTQKMTNETYKYILFFRMRMLSNKLLNYIQYQSDLFDIFAKVQS